MLPLNKMAKEIKCFLQNRMHSTLQDCKHPSLRGGLGRCRGRMGGGGEVM